MTVANISQSPKPAKRERWIAQRKRVYASLFRSPKTRLQVANYESVPIQNVCRYVGDMRKEGLVWVVKKDTCPISEMKAEFLTTNPALMPGKGQLNMFK